MMMRQDPELLAEGYRELAGLLADGTLPLLPVTEHPVTGASSAFHTMASARHTGKLVLTWPAEGVADTPPVRPEDVPVVRPDAHGWPNEAPRPSCSPPRHGEPPLRQTRCGRGLRRV
jgi:hypothetical protein